MNPEDLKFTKEHEWVKAEGKRAMIGITDYAQDELGDIVYIELPEVGEEVSSMEEITEIESTKTTAPVMSPVSGKIIEINEELKDAPELINEDPYGKGWIAVLDMADPAEVEDLMDHKEYDEYLEQEAGCYDALDQCDLARSGGRGHMDLPGDPGHGPDRSQAG